MIKTLNGLGELLSRWNFQPRPNLISFKVRFRSTYLLRQIKNLNQNPFISGRIVGLSRFLPSLQRILFKKLILYYKIIKYILNICEDWING